MTGDTTAGQELTADPGEWANNPTTYAYQWRRCDTNPFQCFDVNGATGKTYGVREADIGFRIRRRRDGIEREGQRDGAVSVDRCRRAEGTGREPPAEQ